VGAALEGRDGVEGGGVIFDLVASGVGAAAEEGVFAFGVAAVGCTAVGVVAMGVGVTVSARGFFDEGVAEDAADGVAAAAGGGREAVDSAGRFWEEEAEGGGAEGVAGAEGGTVVLRAPSAAAFAS